MQWYFKISQAITEELSLICNWGHDIKKKYVFGWTVVSKFGSINWKENWFDHWQIFLGSWLMIKFLDAMLCQNIKAISVGIFVLIIDKFSQSHDDQWNFYTT